MEKVILVRTDTWKVLRVIRQDIEDLESQAIMYLEMDDIEGYRLTFGLLFNLGACCDFLTELVTEDGFNVPLWYCKYLGPLLREVAKSSEGEERELLVNLLECLVNADQLGEW